MWLFLYHGTEIGASIGGLPVGASPLRLQPAEDLRKARFYLNRLIEHLEPPICEEDCADCSSASVAATETAQYHLT